MFLGIDEKYETLSIYVTDKVWDFKEVNDKELNCIPNLILQINLIPNEGSWGKS